MSDNSIRNKATSSLLWSSVEQFGSQGLSLIITIVIARLITPDDYGLIAMLSIFMALSHVFINCGFSNYLIQNKQRTEKDFSTIFFINVTIGILCYVILFIFAPAIAQFYNQPLLSSIIKLYSLTLVISSLILVQRAKLYIDFKYRKLSAITIISLIISGIVAIIMALNNWGVWTLVWYHLLQTIITSVLIWITSGWHPHLIFSVNIAKQAFYFGSKLLGANLLSSGISNLYTLVIGKKFQATELGFYSRGLSLATVFPSNFANMLQQATYPVLCELQEDKEKLKTMFCNYIMMAGMICFPLMGLLFGISEPLVRVLLTDKWLPAIPFLQILTIGYMFDPIMRLNSIILSVTGKTQLSLYSEIIKKAVLVSILFLSLPFGITWVAFGVIIYSLCDLIIVSFFVNKIISFSFWEELKLITPYLLFSFIPCLFALLLNSLDIASLMKLIISIPFCSLAYILLIRNFRRKQYDFILSFLNNIIHKNNG